MARNPIASESAHTDANQQFSVIGVQGTFGTSDVGGTAATVAFSGDPLTGAQYVNVIGGSINVGTITVEPNDTIVGGTIDRIGSIDIIGTMPAVSANPTSGTLNTLGTVGSITNIGSISNIGTMPAISANPASGTQQTLGTVGVVNNIVTGTIASIGSINTITSVSNLAAGTLTALALGTVVGNVASGSADSGNPVKVAAVFQGTQGTVTNGQRVNLQADEVGNLKSYLSTKLDYINDSITVTQGSIVGTFQTSYPNFSYIAAAGTTTIKSGAGVLHSVVIGSLLGGGTLFNSAGISAAVIWSAITPAVNSYPFNLAFGSLTWAGTGTQTLTVVYS